jgi:uncharacterized protein YeaO (DUF488 family)
MPSLGPSERLLHKGREGLVEWRDFLREYRRELFMDGPVDGRSKTIKNHGQKFTLRLLATLARRGNVTILCHCPEDQDRCHRHELRRILVGKPTPRVFTSFAPVAVYTIKHRDDLRHRAAIGGAHTFDERKRWTTAEQLWRRAESIGRDMPVLFGDAARCSDLIYWGILTEVAVSQRGTRFSVDRLRPLRNRRTQDVRLASTRRRIARGFIRPYALCLTPQFLPEQRS